MTLFVSKLNNDDILAGHTICVNNISLFAMFNLALLITANSQFASAVGEGNPNKSKNIMKLNLAVCVLSCFWIYGIAFMFENVFIELFVVGSAMKSAFLITYRMMIYVFFVGDFFSGNLLIFLKALNK